VRDSTPGKYRRRQTENKARWPAHERFQKQVNFNKPSVKMPDELVFELDAGGEFLAKAGKIVAE
jgi:hypothetical protein